MVTRYGVPQRFPPPASSHHQNRVGGGDGGVGGWIWVDPLNFGGEREMGAGGTFGALLGVKQSRNCHISINPSIKQSLLLSLS